MKPIDLKAVRERTRVNNRVGITQSELSAMLREVGIPISQTQISRYEENPGSVPYILMMRWLQVLGTTPEEELRQQGNSSDSEGVNVGNPYRRLRERVSLLEDYLRNSSPVGLNDASASADSELQGVESFESLLAELRRKPVVAVLGVFDAGKSHLINFLLGGPKKIPAAYRPMTAVATFIHHLSDKPKWMAEDVWMLDVGFDPLRWEDQAHVEEHRVIAGNLGSLFEFGTHKGGRAGTAHAALVFIDAPILQACTLVDAPGYHNKPSDTTLAEQASKTFDALLYLSSFQGFLGGPDIDRLKLLLERLPSVEGADPRIPVLGNLFLVATHAHPGISADDVQSVPIEAAADAYRELLPSALQIRSNETGRAIGAIDFAKRAYTFWGDVPDRYATFVAAVCNMLSTDLPIAVDHKANASVENFKLHASQRYSMEIAKWRMLVDRSDKAAEELKQLQLREGERLKDVAKKRAVVAKFIESASARTRGNVLAHAKTIFSADAIEQVLKPRYKSKKNAQEFLGGYVIGLLKIKVDADIAREVKDLKIIVDRYVEGYDASLTLATDGGTIDIPFDSRGAFVGGLLGAGVLGGLGIWASSYGSLGGYILVAKAVSLLAAAGISVGGTATAIGGVAAIGGPLLPAIAIGAGVVLISMAIFGESWQTRMSKKLADHLASEKVDESIAAQTETFWKDTLAAFNAGAEALEAEYRRTVADLASVAEGAITKVDAERKIRKFEEIRDFFAAIPWVKAGRPRDQQ